MLVIVRVEKTIQDIIDEVELHTRTSVHRLVVFVVPPRRDQWWPPEHDPETFVARLHPTDTVGAC